VPRADRVDGRVVDEHVGAAEGLLRTRRDVLDGVGIADVGVHRDRLAPGAGDRVDRLAQPLGLQARGDDPRPTLGQQLRGGAADPGAGPGDDRGLARHGHRRILDRARQSGFGA
jgi:hypothetical protein